MVDLPDPPRIGGKDAPRAEVSCSRYREDDIAQLGEHMAEIAPVPPVRNSSLNAQ